jgi:predicted nuclease of restriction endonuclease-like (RecB) superfamily
MNTRHYAAAGQSGIWIARSQPRRINDCAESPGTSAASSSPGGLNPDDHIRDPFVLEFLNLKDEYSESDLEQALILELERFLLELGNDFAFVARQKRLRIGTECTGSICYFSTGGFDPC